MLNARRGNPIANRSPHSVRDDNLYYARNDKNQDGHAAQVPFAMTIRTAFAMTIRTAFAMIIRTAFTINKFIYKKKAWHKPNFFSGGEESRTPVQNRIPASYYMLSLHFKAQTFLACEGRLEKAQSLVKFQNSAPGIQNSKSDLSSGLFTLRTRVQARRSSKIRLRVRILR